MTALFDEVDALLQARRDMGHYEEWADKSPTVPEPQLLLASAQAYAAIAQAEAARPHWVQIGTHVINLAQVAYINLKSKDFDGNRRVEIGFAATSDGGGMALVFGGEEYDQTVIKLSNALYGCMVGTGIAHAIPSLYRGVSR